MSRLRVLVLGLGARARIWMKVLDANPEIEIVGLCDPSPKARATWLGRYPGVPLLAEAEALFDIPADAALLVTPPAGRLQQVAQAARAGLHILAEKPLADTVEEARDCVSLAEAAGVHLIVGLNFRFLPVTVALRDLLSSGRIGSPEFGRFTYERWRDGMLPHLNKYPLEMAQPMLWEQSIHHFDLMRHVYGREPKRVFAQTFNPSWSMYQDDANVSALFEFEGGFRVNYQGTWAAGWDNLGFEWRTDCSDGVAVQKEMMGALHAARRMDKTLAPVDFDPGEPWVTDAAALLASFVKTCGGKTAPQCTGRDHLRSLAMLEACILSSREGVPVEIGAEGVVTTIEANPTEGTSQR